MPLKDDVQQIAKYEDYNSKKYIIIYGTIFINTSMIIIKVMVISVLEQRSLKDIWHSRWKKFLEPEKSYNIFKMQRINLTIWELK